MDVPFTSIHSFKGNKEFVYMSVSDKSILNNKIIQYDRKTQEYTTLFKSKFKSPSVQGIEINEDWMVWVDCTEWGGYITPYAMNLHTKEIQPLVKEKDDEFLNDFPILAGDYAAWIQKEEQTGRSYILLKNLQTNETESIYELNTLSYRNVDLSSLDGKILFTDEKFNVGYVYLYDVKSKELKEMKTPYERIGGAELINDQQWVYLTYSNELYMGYPLPDTYNLIFYDATTNFTQEVLSDINSIWTLEKDPHNQLYVGYNENDYLEKYRVEKNNLVQVEKLMIKNQLSAENGVYIQHEDLNFQDDSKRKIIIQNELNN